MSTIIYNSKIASASEPCFFYNDRGLNLGHGLFETILINKNTFPALDYHWSRLITSCVAIGISAPFSFHELKNMINELIINNNLQEKIAGARVTITHGNSPRGVLPPTPPLPNFLINVFECASQNDKCFSAVIVKTRKNEHSLSARIKSTSYIDNILAKQEAVNQGYDEAILLNTALNIADGAISNVFMVKDERIITPPVCDGALPGVIRQILIDEFNNQFEISECSITPEAFLSADEIFLTNSLMGVKSVNKIGNKEFDKFTTASKLRAILRKNKNYI